MFGNEAFSRACAIAGRFETSSDAVNTNRVAWSLSVARPLVRKIISIMELSLPGPAPKTEILYTSGK